MAINNARELKKAAEQAGILLQQIQNYCEEQSLTWTNCEDAKVRFPRGFIRPASLQRHRLPFVKRKALKDNLAYTLIVSDVLLWLRLRTDLWGTPADMVTKLYVFVIGTLCESITKEFLRGVCGKNFKKRNEHLLKKGIITHDLQADLNWLWDMRNRMHLFDLASREYENQYDDKCHDRCIRTYRQLLTALRTTA